MPTDRGERRATFATAQREWFGELGYDVSAREVSLPRLALQTQVLEGGRGHPLLLVHGLGSYAAAWAPLMAELPDFRVHAAELPGFGLSDPYDYRGIDVRQLAREYLEDLADVLGLAEVDIVAHSLGAVWALWWAGAAPTRVRSLTLLGCPAPLLGSSLPVAMRVFGVPRLNRGLLRLSQIRPRPAQTVSTLQQVMGEPAVANLSDAAIACAFRADLLPGTPLAFTSLMETLVPWGRRAARWVCDPADLQRVTQPVQFVWGERDAFGTPAIGRAACEHLANARIQTFDAGHAPWVDDAGHCARAVREFVNSIGAAPAVQ